MSQLNEKFYNLLNGIYNKTLTRKDLSHEDYVVLLECGYLRRDNPNFISSEGILALDEYRSSISEKNKSTKILYVSIASLIVSGIALLVNIFLHLIFK